MKYSNWKYINKNKMRIKIFKLEFEKTGHFSFENNYFQDGINQSHNGNKQFQNENKLI